MTNNKVKIAKAHPFSDSTTFSEFLNTMWDYVKSSFTFDVKVNKYVVDEKEVDCVTYTYAKSNRKNAKSCTIRFIDDVEGHTHSPRYCEYKYEYQLELYTKDITKESTRDKFATFYRQAIEDILNYPNWNIGKEFEDIVSSNQDVEVRFSNIIESLDIFGRAKMTADYCVVFVDKQ